MSAERIPISDVVFRDDLYPRIEHSQQKAQEYAEHLERLPPIEVNQHRELIDGFHRLTAHRLNEVDSIAVTVTETRSDDHLLELAIAANAEHGLQLSTSDKRKMAIRLYAVSERTADRKRELSELLAVSSKTVERWVSDLDQAARDEQKRIMLEMWHQCYTDQEIGEAVDMTQQAVTAALSQILDKCRKFVKVTFFEDGWKPPLFNVWAFAKKTNATTHFGNTEQRIVDNLLWLYTEPADIVVDPFGGGASTLDACMHRGRRCWLSDRKPQPGLESKIRTLDIVTDLPPLHKRWADVSLTYLDPPYWRQAQGEYSDDAEDLANMPREEFTNKLAGVVTRIAAKQTRGVIALIIQPTQWRSEPKGAFSDHVLDVIRIVSKSKRLTLENRISCPYSTEQCTPQMVEWARENRKPLVLSRELIVWRCGSR